MKTNPIEWDIAYSELDTTFQCPLFVFYRKGHARVSNIIQTFQDGKQFKILSGVPEVVHQKCRELVETVELASRNHVKQFLGREGDDSGLDDTGTMLQGTNEH